MDAVAKTLMVGTGGFIGANLRYWLGGYISSRLADATFPWQTMFINVTGSMIIGLFMGLMTGLNWNPNWRLFFAIGILGGYTTYSSFAYESIGLLGNKQYVAALLYIEGTALLTVFGAWLGLVGSRLLLGGRA
jgi:CrcB protein